MTEERRVPWYSLNSEQGTVLRFYGSLYLGAFFTYYLIWALFNYVLQPDTSAYLEMGRGVFEHFIFGYKTTDGIYYPNAFRMPAVPLLLGALYKVFDDSEWTYFAYSLFQVMVAALLPCIAWYWGAKVSRLTAWLAYGFLLVHANVIACFIFVLTDIPFAAMSGLAFIALWRGLESDSRTSLFRAGLVAGAACLFRPIMKLYFTVAFACSITRRFRPQKLAVYSAVFIAGFVLPLLPWVARSLYHYGVPVLETNQGLNLLWSNSHLVELKPSDSYETRRIKEHIMRNRPDKAIQFLFVDGYDQWVKHDLVISNKLQKVAVEAYLEKPQEVLKMWFRLFGAMTTYQVHYDEMHSLSIRRPFYGFLREMMPLSPENFDRKFYHAFLELKRAVRLGYTYLAWVGLALLTYRKPKLGAFVALHILYFTGLTAFIAGYDRYRLNLECFYAVLIVFPCAQAWEFINHRWALRSGASLTE